MNNKVLKIDELKEGNLYSSSYGDTIFLKYDNKLYEYILNYEMWVKSKIEFNEVLEMDFLDFEYLIDWSKVDKFQKIKFTEDTFFKEGFLISYSTDIKRLRVLTLRDEIVIATRYFIDNLENINKECLIRGGEVFKNNILRKFDKQFENCAIC